MRVGHKVKTPGTLSSGGLPDFPTPALPKTASFTSGLLAMAAKISGPVSDPRGQPTILSASGTHGGHESEWS